jgi:hypothetical protein
MINLFLKTYCECNDQKIAEGIAGFIQKKLHGLCDVSLFKIEKYWKVEEYFEISFDLERVSNIDVVLNCLASGWEKSGSNYIWDDKTNASFISDTTRWAQLEIIE